MERHLTRKGFLARGAALAGALALPASAFARGPKTAAVYKLVTGCGHGACACNACFHHDRNSLFPTAKAADGNRAHTGCNCTIVRGSLHYGTYVALFGEPKNLRRYRVDLRHRSVRALVKQNPPRF